MSVKPLNHYSLTTPASIYDEEALTALELAGRTAAKVNENVEAFNKLEKETNDHLTEQDKEIDDRTAAQDAAIERIRTVTVPEDVKKECARLIADGKFDKAISLYLGNLNERVDNLLSGVTEGSTTLDAELIDTRLGWDGRSYSNAGTAIRDQITDINNVLTIKPRWISNTYVRNYDGSEVAIEAYKATEFVAIPSTLKRIGVRTCMAEDVSGICFYDENKNFISGVNNIGGQSTTYSEIILDVPGDASYIRYSFCVNYLSETYSYLFFVDSLLSLFNEKKEQPVYISLETQQKCYLNADGGYYTIDNENFCVAQLDVVPYQSFILNATSVDGSRIYAIYDKNGNVISVYPNTNQTPAKTETVNIIIPENGVSLMLGSYKTDIFIYEEVNAENVKARLDTLSKKVDSINANPFYSMAFDNIICIGDSLTAGACYINGWTGSAIKQNYPYYLGRMLNTNVRNAGRSGWSASDWYRDFINFYDFTQYDGAIIWLGTNYGCNTVPTDAEINAFVPDTTVSPDVADQSLYLIAIIKKILSDNPDCKIFLCNVFASKANVSNNNAVIDQIVDKYGLQLIDMSDLGVDKYPSLHGNIKNVHFGKAGNMFIANRIRMAINDYIAADPVRAEFGY